MSDRNTMAVARATAIAATNAVIKHLNIGLFMSEFTNLSDAYSLRWCKLAGNTQVQVAGRTNIGHWIVGSNTVIYKADRSGKFPVERVYVSIHNPDRDGFTEEHAYFDVTFGSEVVVERMAQSPLQDILSKPKHISDVDDSPDAWTSRYPS